MMDRGGINEMGLRARQSRKPTVATANVARMAEKRKGRGTAFTVILFRNGGTIEEKM
jgi:hypothetical protein